MMCLPLVQEALSEYWKRCSSGCTLGRKLGAPPRPLWPATDRPIKPVPEFIRLVLNESACLSVIQPNRASFTRLDREVEVHMNRPFLTRTTSSPLLLSASPVVETAAVCRPLGEMKCS